MQFCTQCGQRLVEGARFCVACGHQVAASAPTDPTAPASAENAAPAPENTPPATPVPSAPMPAGDTTEIPATTEDSSQDTAEFPAAPAEDETGTENGRPLVVVEDHTAGGTGTATYVGGPTYPNAPTGAAAEGGAPSAPQAGTTVADALGRASSSLPAFRPAAMSQPQAVAAARDGALAYGITLASLTVLVTLGALLFGGDHRGAPVDWFRTATMLLGLGVHAPLELSFPGVGDVSITLTPLLITLVIAGIVAAVTWRAGRTRPAGPAGTALPEALLTGATFGALAGLVAAMSSGPLSYAQDLTRGAEGFFSARTAPLLTFLTSTVLVTLLAAAGRAAAGATGLRAMREGVGASLGTWRPYARLTRDLTLGILLSGILTGIVLVLSNGGSPSDVAYDATRDAVGSSAADAGSAAGWWAFWLMLPNLLVTLAGFGAGGSLAVDGAATVADADKPYRYQNSFGLLTGANGLEGLPLAVLLVMLVVLAIGVRAALQHAPEERTVERWWKPALLMALVWAVLAWVTRIGGHGVVDTTFFTKIQGEGHGSVGLGLPSTMLMTALWGALAAFAGTVLARALAGSRPDWVARLGGRHLHPEWAILLADAELRAGRQPVGRLAPVADDLRAGRISPPTRPLADTRDRDRKALLVLGGLLAAALLLTLARTVISATVYTPERAVSSYLGSVEGKHAQDALGHVAADSTPEGTTPLLQDGAMGTLPDHEVEDATPAERGSEAREVPVRFTTKDGDVHRTYHVVKEGRAFGLFDEWKVVDPFSVLSLTSDDSGTTGDLKIGSATVKLGDAQALTAFPGIYEVTAAPQPGFEVAPQTVVALGSEPRTVSVDGTVSKKGQEALDAAVKKLVDGCAAQTSTNPPGCKFTGWGLTEPVRYRVLTYPKVTLQPAMEPDLPPMVTTMTPGTFAATTPGMFGGGPQTQNVTFVIDGSFSWDGASPDTAKITPDVPADTL